MRHFQHVVSSEIMIWVHVNHGTVHDGNLSRIRDYV